MNIPQTLISVVLLFALVFGVRGFFFEHREKSVTPLYKPSNTETDPEFAPEYTKKRTYMVNSQKILFGSRQYLYSASYGFFDWLGEYAKVAHCYEYGPIKGTHLIMYGLFVGLPFTLATLLFVLEGVKAIKVIKVGQFPLPGQKVVKPTKYKYGNAARISGALLIAAVMFLFGLAAWGFVQAKEITRDIKPCEINQSVNKQLHRTP